jgi:5,10-methenyltetrahydrofolate synthetase
MSETLPDRDTLRQRLIAARRDWAATPAFAAAQAGVQAALAALLEQLEPEVVGVYWPLAGEFAPGVEGQALALPYARRGGQMDFRRWDGGAPALKDECGIPSSGGAVVVPDVVLVPCVGFSRQGFRLGYGGGYFDRWLARHPGVTSVGLAWSGAEIALAPAAHDQALTLVLTEAGAIVAE